MKKLLLGALALTAVAAAQARTLSPEEALQRALSGASSQAKAVAINLSRAIKHQFGTRAVAVSSSRFEDLCTFLKSRIDNTPVGKGNVRKGVPNYRAFPL